MNTACNVLTTRWSPISWLLSQWWWCFHSGVVWVCWFGCVNSRTPVPFLCADNMIRRVPECDAPEFPLPVLLLWTDESLSWRLVSPVCLETVNIMFLARMSAVYFMLALASASFYAAANMNMAHDQNMVLTSSLQDKLDWWIFSKLGWHHMKTHSVLRLLFFYISAGGRLVLPLYCCWVVFCPSVKVQNGSVG